MMDYKNIDREKLVYVFEIDEVLFPERDYLLQVYYLFSNFVEYTEGRAIAKDLLDYMKRVFEEKGASAVIPETLEHFQLADSYVENFERLRANAHLPLKLFLKEEAKALLLSLFGAGKQVGLLTDGNPVEQLNKLKHMDWQELQAHLPSLKIFFTKELLFRNINPIDYLVQEYNVAEEDIIVVGKV
ncbi:HAD family hydrolase [Sphingobacterium oryzagri]|uniref:HAD family hydrolase n=1 Tax=Sphingobacterium oryzagri TaxID=3025669 RepID=A0ABY7WII7_9SPHI|nr:HAD family hydrolase [Sphingobacterium sp. KACC 22765]WDF68110.1 HAD family hydrolase [Sphingobacterium sp. KACC 22765]